MTKTLLGAAALLLVVGCSADATEDRTASDAANDIKGAVSEVNKVEDLTEETDGNDLLGRPNGYEAATVLHDSRVECLGGPGVDCGAVIEQWPDGDAAQERVDYIESLGAIANEYDHIDGSLVLRISGSLKPSEAEEYAEAFGG